MSTWNINNEIDLASGVKLDLLQKDVGASVQITAPEGFVYPTDGSPLLLDISHDDANKIVQKLVRMIANIS